jgi:hypothetical protein
MWWKSSFCIVEFEIEIWYLNKALMHLPPLVHGTIKTQRNERERATGCKNGTALRCLRVFFLAVDFRHPENISCFWLKKKSGFLCGLGIRRKSDVSVGPWTGGAVIPSVTSRKPCYWLFPLKEWNTSAVLARTHSHLLCSWSTRSVLASSVLSAM